MFGKNCLYLNKTLAKPVKFAGLLEMLVFFMRCDKTNTCLTAEKPHQIQ